MKPICLEDNYNNHHHHHHKRKTCPACNPLSICKWTLCKRRNTHLIVNCFQQPGTSHDLMEVFQVWIASEGIPNLEQQSWSLSVAPNTHQFSCSTLASLIQPQSRYHCREIRSPNTRHKNGGFTDLEKQQKALVNQSACQSRNFTIKAWKPSESSTETIPAPPLELPREVEMYR